MNEFDCAWKDENKLLACNEAYEAVLFNAVEKFYIGDDAREVSERDDTEIVRENKSLMQAALTAFTSVSGKESCLYFMPVASQMIISIIKKKSSATTLIY